MRAKMKLEEVAPAANGGARVRLRPVYGGSAENDAFFAATPSGEVNLELSAAAYEATGLADAKLGSEFYLTIAPAAPVPMALADPLAAAA